MKLFQNLGMRDMAELNTPFTDLAVCRETLSTGSRSFWLASQLLPPALKNAACGLYAFCRDADDLIDDGDDPERALRILHQRLNRIYAGKPDDNPVDRVLEQIIKDHNLPRALLDALLEGFAWDNAGRRYQNLSEVYDYSARVAGSVGVLMALLMGIRDESALARAADLGVAMQLTNIARDVGEDARNGRLYLPLDALKAAGIDPNEFLANPQHSDALGSVISDLLTHAAHLYQRADSGIRQLPRSARGGIYAARLLYAAIGDTLSTLNHNAVEQRAIVGIQTKATLVARSLRIPVTNNEDLHAKPLTECKYLIQLAAQAGQRTESYLGMSAPKAFYLRMTWILDVFAHLEERQQKTLADKGR